ncbi:MAG TPA: hypothetical protein VIX35_09360 [Vicinamibacterales bacterium]
MRVLVLTVCVASAAALAPMRVRAQATRADSPPTLNVLLASAASYLDAYEQTFSAVVAEEQYTQTTKAPAGAVLFSADPTRRDLRSDVMVLNLGTSQWVEFRDVYEVDNSLLPDHEGRLQKLFQTASPDTISVAQRYANESARYNIGVSRTTNVPTMALAYLSRRNQLRSAFELAGREGIRGIVTQVVKFRETATPSLIVTRTVAASVSGRFWIEPASGAVLRTELTLVMTSPRKLTGTTTVEYALAPTLKLLVPVQMDEEYRLGGGEVDRGRATYSNFRAFTVSSKIIKRALQE